jgi:hypothetical protein
MASDSLDNWLEELICIDRNGSSSSAALPVIHDSSCTVGQDSDDEWLQELIIAPTWSVPGTLALLREAERPARAAFSIACTPPEPGRPARVAVLTHRTVGASLPSEPHGCLSPRRAGVSCPPELYDPGRPQQCLDGASRPAPARQRSRGGDRVLPCHGCIDDMLLEHANIMARLSIGGHIAITGMHVMIRKHGCNYSCRGLDILAQQMQEHVRRLLEQRGICIFKIGITHDPLHRMFNMVMDTQCVASY